MSINSSKPLASQAGKLYLLLQFLWPLLGYALYGSAQELDTYLSPIKILGAVLVMLWFSQCLWAWGECLRREFWATVLPPAAAIALGSAAMIFWATLLAFSGALRESLFPLYLLICSIAPIYLALQNQFDILKNTSRSFRCVRRQFSYLGSLSTIFSFLLLILLLIIASRTLVAHSFWDPLWYHLVAPRKWLELGGFAPIPSSAAMYLTSLWDHLYIWPALLLGGTSGRGMIVVQLFSQWLHFFAGLGGTLFALFHLTKAFLPARYLSLVMVIALGSISLTYHAAFAKNDFGTAALMLAALLPFARYRRDVTRNHVIVSGFFLGLAIAAKQTAIFPAVAVVAIVIYELSRSQKLRTVLYLPLAAFLPVAVLLLRNWIYVGNPFFPMTIFNFGNPLPESWSTINDYAFSFALNYGRVLELLHDNLANLCLFCIPFLIRFLPHKRSLIWLVSWLLAFLLFALCIGPRAELRLFNSGLILLPGLAVILLLQAGRALSLTKRPILLILSLLLIASQFRTPILHGKYIRELMDIKPYHEQIRAHVGGASLAWVRLEVPKSNGIAFLSEGRTYYLSHLSSVRVFDDADLDRRLRMSKSPLDAILALTDRGLYYVVHTAERLDLYYNEAIVSLFESLVKIYPEVVAYRTEYSWVMDVRKLKTILQRNESR